MTNFKTIALILAVTATTAIAYFFTTQTNEEKSITNHSSPTFSQVDEPEILSEEHAFDPLKDPQDAAFLKEEKAFEKWVSEEEQVLNELVTENQSDTWIEHETNEMAPSANYLISEMNNIKVSERLSLHKQGDKVKMRLPNNQEIEVVVTKEKSSKNGSHGWSGHLTEHGDNYPVTVTQGKGHLFATISTPNGTYSLESINGIGTLYKNPDNLLTDSNQTDSLEIPKG